MRSRLGGLALGSGRHGRRDRLGGQMTAQAVSGRHPWIESFGYARSYRHLARDREYYRVLPDQPGPADPARSGNGFVSPCHEPRVSQAVLEAFLAPTGRRTEGAAAP